MVCRSPNQKSRPLLTSQSQPTDLPDSMAKRSRSLAEPASAARSRPARYSRSRQKPPAPKMKPTQQAGEPPFLIGLTTAQQVPYAKDRDCYHRQHGKGKSVLWMTGIKLDRLLELQRQLPPAQGHPDEPTGNSAVKNIRACPAQPHRGRR